MCRLATARLDLRMLREDDLDVYADMCADAEVMRFIGAGGPVEADVAWRQMALFLGEWALHRYGMWAVEERASGRLTGRVGFLNPSDGRRARSAGSWPATRGVRASPSRQRVLRSPMDERTLESAS